MNTRNARNARSATKAMLLAALFCLLALPPFAAAKGDQRDPHQDAREIEAPMAVVPGLKHLLAFVKNGREPVFDKDRVAGVIDFVTAPKKEEKIYSIPNGEEGPSAYYELQVDKSLACILEYAYNPEVPSILVSPSSTRLSYWKTIQGRKQPLPKLWRQLPATEEPYIIHGVETIENTPDLHTGAYYRYDLDRTLILLQDRGHNVLLSLSGQNEASEVGKKGAVVGPDDQWNYLYSEKKGLNKFGMGWVDSYMYSSYSVIVYYETREPTPRVKVGIFKWLRAGWKNINMVKTHHIHNGLIRFSDTYKEILENRSLPDPDDLAAFWSRVEKVEPGRLKKMMRAYFQSLATVYSDDESLSAGWVENILNDESSVEGMGRREMQTVLFLEYLKKALGKQQVINIDQIGL